MRGLINAALLSKKLMMNHSVIFVQSYVLFKKEIIEKRIHELQNTNAKVPGEIQYCNWAKVIIKNAEKIDANSICNLLLGCIETALLNNSILNMTTEGSVSNMLKPIPYFFRINPTIKVDISSFLLGVRLISCENNISSNVTEIYFIFSTLILLRTIKIFINRDETELYFYETEQIVCQ